MPHRSLLAALLLATSLLPAAEPPRNVESRSDFTNSRIRFERDGKGHVAFIGGSITEMDGYRPMVAEWLRKRFPETEFHFENAGISSTCSTTGAFRLHHQVLQPRGPVDLLLIEFAVNDDQDAGHARRECIRGMEGLIRQARRENPAIDIVVTYFVNPGMLEQIQAGTTPVPIAAHETVARFYRVPTVYVAKEVAARIGEGRLTWEKYGGTHPKPFGNAIAAEMVTGLLEAAWDEPLPKNAEARPHPLPKKPIDPGSYFHGRRVHGKAATNVEGWTWSEPEWESLPGALRKRFAGRKLWHAEEPGATTKLDFPGRAVGAYVLAGPDAGIVEVRVDGGEWKAVDLYHRFSRGLHYPRTVMFFTDLKPGPHTLELRIADEKNAASQGHAARILWWAVNSETLAGAGSGSE